MKHIRLTLPAILLAAIAWLAAIAPPAMAITTGWSDKYENEIGIDHAIRGQAHTAVATHYFGLSTAACDDTGAGAEPSGNGYARVSVTASLANFAGTQGPGTTTASSGNGGQTSNNGAITFPTSTGAWASGSNLVSVRTYDASSGGNQTTCIELTSAFAVTITGVTVSFPAASWSLTIN